MAPAPQAQAAPSPPSSAPGPLQVRGVTVTASGNTLLHSISAVLHPGEMCALIGPSGAGKSTLIKVLLGLWTPAAGTVRLGGTPIPDVGPVGYVPQDDVLHTSLTVERALHYASLLRLPSADDGQRRARVDQVIGQVGLQERRSLRIRRLSGGQRKRVSVALELLTSPGLLILDEPTSGLDPGMEAHMMALFEQVAAAGRVVLVSTHAMESVTRARALLILMDGRVTYLGPPGEACGYFGVQRYADIFTALKQRKAAEWQAAYEASPLRRSFAGRPPPAPVGKPS